LWLKYDLDFTKEPSKEQIDNIKNQSKLLNTLYLEAKKNPINKVNKIENKDIENWFYTNYMWYDILQIQWFVSNIKFFDIWKNIIDSNDLSIVSKTNIIKRLNSYIKAYYSEYINDFWKYSLQKEYILLQSAYKKEFWYLLDIKKKVENIKDEKNKKINTWFKYYNYMWYDILQIEYLKPSSWFKNFAINIINNKWISIQDKKNLIIRLNSFLISIYELQIAKENNKEISIYEKMYKKQLLLLKFAILKI
jgi:hypothetical protein